MNGEGHYCKTCRRHWSMNCDCKEESKSASAQGSKAHIKPAKDYGNKELIDLALQTHARACAFGSPELHDRAIEARIELLRRLEKP